MPIMTVGHVRSPRSQPDRRERIQTMGKRKSTRPRVVESLEERQLLSGGLGYLLQHEPVMHFRQLSPRADHHGGASVIQQVRGGPRARLRALRLAASQANASTTSNASTSPTVATTSGSANTPILFAASSPSPAASPPAPSTSAASNVPTSATVAAASASNTSTSASDTTSASAAASPAQAQTPTVAPLISPVGTLAAASGT